MGQKGIVHLSISYKNTVKNGIQEVHHLPRTLQTAYPLPPAVSYRKAKSHHPLSGMMALSMMKSFMNEFPQKGLGLVGQGKMISEQVFFSIYKWNCS
jgi:hypothetical protein